MSCFADPVLDSIPKHDSLLIYSNHTKENRVVNIWFPPIYNQSNESLPVLYMPDGGTKEDFPHIANTLAKLIGEKKIPPHILVGIENTERWRDLTGASNVKKHKKYKIPMTDGAKHFRAFIAEELIPKINDMYRTTDKKGIIGESLGGLFVMETLLLQPELFDFYISVDPSLWWNNNYLGKNAIEFLKTLPQKQTKLWFAGSDVKDISKHTIRLSKLLTKDTSHRLLWKYSNEPLEKHNTIFRATKEKAMIWIMND
jgi:predicted alpha/beta superfamily hydrolase